MRAVMAFATKSATAMGKAATSGQGGSGPFTAKQIGGASRGLSVLGSISEYAGARQRAAALDQDARDEALAGRQEYIVASERVTQIDDDYNRLVGEQLVTAAAYGIDAGSGSVVQARRAAQGDADRERTVIRNTAETNARLRKVRELSLRQAAKNNRFGATVKLGVDVASAFVGG